MYTCSQDVAREAIALPADMSTGDVLRALTACWRAGYAAGKSDGFRDGVQIGQTHMASTIDAVMGALQP